MGAAKQVGVEHVNEHVVALVTERRVVVHGHDLQIVALQVRDESIRTRICAGEEEQDASGHPGDTNLGGEVGLGPRCPQEFCRQRVGGFAIWLGSVGWRQCRWLIGVAVDAGGDGGIEALLASRAPGEEVFIERGFASANCAELLWDPNKETPGLPLRAP